MPQECGAHRQARRGHVLFVPVCGPRSERRQPALLLSHRGRNFQLPAQPHARLERHRANPHDYRQRGHLWAQPSLHQQHRAERGGRPAGPKPERVCLAVASVHRARHHARRHQQQCLRVRFDLPDHPSTPPFASLPIPLNHSHCSANFCFSPSLSLYFFFSLFLCLTHTGDFEFQRATHAFLEGREFRSASP